MKAFSISILIIFGIPLLVIPFVWMATLMALANISTLDPDTSIALMIIAPLSMLLASAYPAVYVCCFNQFIKSIKASNPSIKPVLIIPLYFLIAAIMISIWQSLEHAAIQ